jgi:hypothetical protein
MEAHAKRPRLRKVDVRVPVLVRADIDWTTLRLDDVDDSVRRHIDGRSTVNALASALDLSERRVQGSLAKLARKGIVTFVERRRTTTTPCPPRLQSGMHPATQTRPSVHPSSPPPSEARTREVQAMVESALIDEIIADDAIVDCVEPEGRATLTGIGPMARAN